MAGPDFVRVMECSSDEYSDRLYARRPNWVQGFISHFDARYLFGRALEPCTDIFVELGTASGVSTAFLCSALHVRSQAAANRGDFEVRSYDLNPRFYADEGRQAGDAAREMLPAELAEHITFCSPATSITIGEEFPADSIEFLFVDANHKHPWPALDLLATLESLRPGAEVVLHDINLPVRQADGPRGVKQLFDELDLEKQVDSTDPVPNIGSLWVPTDKEALRDQLISIVHAHEWEADVWDDITSRLLP